MVNCECLKFRFNKNHQKLDLYQASQKFVVEVYRLSNALPAAEKFGMITQIRRAALSVHLNIAEGSSRKSVQERKRYYEISRGSLIEIDAALDIAKELKYLELIQIEELGKLMITCFKILTVMIDPRSKH
jgi:four helix bundle protein